MNILVIDDDKNIRELLYDALTKLNNKVFTVEDGIEGLEYFKREKIEICFLDLWMPKIGGIEVLQKIKDEFPTVEIVMISGEAKIDHAVKATKIGAFDFLEKPFSIEKIIEVIDRIKKQKKEIVYHKNTMKEELIIGESQSIKYIKELIENSSKSDARILITGENGTGKEVIARTIHLKSSRKNMSFIGINCAAIPENLIESELFGYIKGSFTGAVNNKIGKFEYADQGTLFLDEVADMSLQTQAKVLRTLQEMKITKIGSTESKKINVRIISATNKDIKEEIRKGNFREDLYYRLNVIPIYVPALRERKQDITLFIEYYLNEFAIENNTLKKGISEEAINYMTNYIWPGNVRQLRNIIERLNIMIQNEVIGIDDVRNCLDEESKSNTFSTKKEKFENYNLNDARDEFEKNFINQKLVENNFNISKTAKTLGLYPSNLHSKINKLRIDIEDLKKKTKGNDVREIE